MSAIRRPRARNTAQNSETTFPASSILRSWSLLSIAASRFGRRDRERDISAAVTHRRRAGQFHARHQSQRGGRRRDPRLRRRNQTAVQSDCGDGADGGRPEVLRAHPDRGRSLRRRMDRRRHGEGRDQIRAFRPRPLGDLFGCVASVHVGPGSSPRQPAPRIAVRGARTQNAPNGRDRVDHGPGGHDDLCNSAALALVLAAVPAQKIPIVAPIVIRASEANPAHSGYGRDSFAPIGGRTI